MSLRLITPPAVEPVSLGEAKLHLRVGLDDDDALISAQVAAARQSCEVEVDRSFVATTWELILHGFPGRCRRWGEWGDTDRIELPRPPLLSVTSVTYVDVDGLSTALDPSAYQVCDVGTTGPGFLVPAHGTSWPATRDRPGALVVRYVAGYGVTAADVPACVKAAILLTVGHLYENREATVPDRASFVLPLGVAALLDFARWGPYS